MRTMLKVTIETQAGNRAIKENQIGGIVKNFVERAKPEASYFTAWGGKRTAFFVFDLTDSALLPPLLEPFFTQLNADCEIQPVMNADELGKGLEAIAKNR